MTLFAVKLVQRMQFSTQMPQLAGVSTQIPTPLLLIEADADARVRHADILLEGGYEVVATAAFPSLDELGTTRLILSDEPSFQWLQHSGGTEVVERVRVVVLTDDVKAGVTACLCGAADWLPVQSDPDYLLSTIREVTKTAR